MCELKKAPCDYFKPFDPPICPPIPFDPSQNISVPVYGCPSTITTYKDINIVPTDLNGTSYNYGSAKRSEE